MNSMEYLDKAKEKLGIQSDNGISKHLGITRCAISNYRSGTSKMDDFTAAKIAEILEIDPLIVIAAANAEREKGERREYWEKVSKRLGGIAAGFLVFSTALPALIQHGHTMYIMLKEKLSELICQSLISRLNMAHELN